MTIPASVLIFIGVLVMGVQSWFSGNWKITALMAILGTCLNCIFFFRRLAIQEELHRHIRELKAKLTASSQTQP
ncbi:MAG TPA: hypothetical protein VGZ93_13215 [Candidatus Methylacidiphilales bacterium]|nr:hypothetical protein [Candidatus Methylacidiphilales bacterium]